MKTLLLLSVAMGYYQISNCNSLERHHNLPLHHHFHKRGFQVTENATIEHFYLNSEAVKGLGSRAAPLRLNKREVTSSDQQQQELLTFTQKLSNNVTRILEELLMDYDQTERPPSQGPTDVKVSILIRSMGPISDIDMHYSMDCYFRQYWRDSRLSFKGLKMNSNQLHINQLSLNVKMLEKIWKPDTYFHNGLDSYLHTITRPNKLFRISENGDITYSMRLTIKARCPMMLSNFPMDWQSCPLVFGSFAYPSSEVTYRWHNPTMAVGYEGELQMSQFDIIDNKYRQVNFSRDATGTFSCLQVVFLLQRHTGYFLIQVYVPCTLIVVLSWVGFWLNREATSDRVGLGITAVLTLSTIALDSRTGLPKVHYATALDWFIICSFLYCMASLLEFAGVHYFTKVGSGEVFSIPLEEDLYSNKDQDEPENVLERSSTTSPSLGLDSVATMSAFNHVYNIKEYFYISPVENQNKVCPAHNNVNNVRINKINNTGSSNGAGRHSVYSPTSLTSSRSVSRAAGTQTEPKPSILAQIMLCLLANQDYRTKRSAEAKGRGVIVNSSSRIDRMARLMFPLSFTAFNILYWLSYSQGEVTFTWDDHKLSAGG